MKFGKVHIFALMLVLCFSIANATMSYNESGGYNGYYNNGFGFFNPEYFATNGQPDIYGRALSNSDLIPLIADLDNNGINDIVVFDNGYVKVFKNKELTQVNSYAIGVTERMSNPLLFDIDGDGITEIIFALEQTEQLRILQLNSTTLFLKNTISLTGLTHTDGEMLIKCANPNYCMLAFASEYTNTVTGATITIRAVGFNSTSLGTQTSLIAYANANQVGVFCFPKIRNMVYENYDSHISTDSEFIFSSIFVDTGSGRGESMQNYYVNMPLNLTTITTKRRVTVNLGDILEPTIIGGARCDYVNMVSETNDRNMDAGALITSPLVADFNSPSSDGLETAIAFNRDNNEYRMFVLDAGVTTTTIVASSCTSPCLDDYPEASNSFGEIISNPIKINAFPNKASTPDLKNDFCVMGYNDLFQRLEFTCGSMQDTFGALSYESLVYQYATNGTFNVSRTTRENNIISHAVDMSRTNIIGTNNMDELLNPYGVFELTPSDSLFSTCYLFGNCDMNLIYTNPKPNGVVLSVDVQKVGREDLIVMQNNNLWYIDDGYSNSDATITNADINPCLENNAIWQLNTTVGISITPTDIDGDMVSAKAILYYNNPNQQNSDWSLNYSSGTVIDIPYPFVANATISNGILRLMAKDTFTQVEDIIDVSFTVANSGLVYGDCITHLAITPTVTGGLNLTGLLNPNQNNNSISNILANLDAVTGAGFGIKIWYILAMIIVTAVIFFAKDITETLKFWFAIIINTGMLILGGLLGIFGFIIIFMYLIVLISAVVMWLKNKLTGSQQGG